MSDLVIIENFIGGEYYRPSSYIDSYEPATGTVWARVPNSGPDDVNKAVVVARNAFTKWSECSPSVRATYLNMIADILESRLEQFAIAESRDQGKPLSLARTVEIPRAVLNFRHFASTAAHHLDTSNFLPEANALNYTVRSAVGVAGLISPWNLPLYLLTFKIAPAIAAGNTVVCKPSEMTSVTAWMLCDVLKAAGLPDGVVNMVFGTGPSAGEALVTHPDVPLISFTGSTATGQKIFEKSAVHFKKLSLEMGGKNAAIIFDDTDLTKCIPTTVRSSFLNQGEVCLCTSRIYVQKGLYLEFLSQFIAATKGMKVGPSLDTDTNVGALISKEHLAKVKSYVELAKEEGGTVHCGEGIQSLSLPQNYKEGYYMLPTIISGISDDKRCMQEEIFGPVTVVVPFDTEEEVIQRANGVKYGLCASVWSQDVGQIHRVAQRLKVGTVWCNCWLVRSLDMPFGGVKQSGIGREGTNESLEFFTEVKTVCVNCG